MTLPKIPIYSGDVPQRTQAPEVFSANADSCLAYQLPLANSFNALAEYLNKYNYADGGFFTPEASQQYPIITEMDLNIYYAITFPNPNDTYTYTSGNLNGVTVQGGTVIRFDNETSTWSYAQPYGGGVSQASFSEAITRVDDLEFEVALLQEELDSKGTIEVFNGSLIANGSNTVTLPIDYLNYDAIEIYGNLSSTPGYIYRVGTTLPLTVLQTNILLGQFVSPGVGSSGLVLSRTDETLTFGTVKSGGATGDAVVSYVALIKY